MAYYKNQNYLATSDSAEFDKIHTPGTAAPHSAIYRCEGCGTEVASNQGQPLPSQNHSQHTQAQGAIRWRMVVYAVHKKD
jgi:hypothetical protein